MGPDAIEGTSRASSEEGTSTSIADTNDESVAAAAEASTAVFPQMPGGHRRSFVVYVRAESVDRGKSANLLSHYRRRERFLGSNISADPESRGSDIVDNDVRRARCLG